MTLPMEKFTYRAHAVAADLGYTKDNKPQVSVTFAIDNDGCTGETITWIGHFTEKTTARTVESMQHLGFPSDDLEQLAELDADGAARLLPNPVDLVCEPEEYDGQWTLKVRWVNRAGAGSFAFKAPMRGPDLKAFAAQMKSTLRNARGASRPTNGAGAARLPGPPAKASGGNGNDDIPF